MLTRAARYAVLVASSLLFFAPTRSLHAQSTLAPPLYWEYRDFSIPNRREAFLQLTIVPHFYMADPPMHVEEITVPLCERNMPKHKDARPVTDSCRDGSRAVSQFGPFPSGELVFADLIELHHKFWLLVATQWQGDLLSFELDGDRLIMQSDPGATRKSAQILERKLVTRLREIKECVDYR